VVAAGQEVEAMVLPPPKLETLQDVEAEVGHRARISASRAKANEAINKAVKVLDCKELDEKKACSKLSAEKRAMHWTSSSAMKGTGSCRLLNMNCCVLACLRVIV
jgi:hypothetical protein